MNRQAQSINGSVRLRAEATEDARSRPEQLSMRAGSHRPRFLHLALFFMAYVLGCAFATALAIAPGTDVSIWPPGGLMMATLILAPPPSWPWWILSGCLAEILGQFVWWQSPLPAALLIYVGNALEAAAGAWLINRTSRRRPIQLDTLREVLAFVVLGAGIAPVISATVGSAALAWFGVKSQTFTGAWPLWWVGDATGVLIVAPLALAVLQKWHGEARLSAARWIEAGVLGLILLGVAALSLSGYMPFAYIIMPPLLWAAVRFEFKGAVVCLTLLALITAFFTLSDPGHLVGDAASRRQKQLTLQLFLAVSAFSALIVAAISRQYQQALLTLRESERNLSQLINMVPSLIWRLTPDGTPVFFNKRAIDFFGLDVGDADKPSTSRLAAIIEAVAHPDDAAELARALGRCVATGEHFSMRYRLRRTDGAYRWMLGRAEPLRDDAGSILQWYGLTQDIDDEVRAQEALQQAADKLARASQAASLAELSASIAHEINQPLAAVVANSHACQRWLESDPPNMVRAQLTVGRIIRDANSAAEVVSRIRGLFKQAVQARSFSTLDPVLDEVRRWVADLAAKNATTIETQIDPGLPAITFDPVQIQQVLINLMRNAVEAMQASTRPRTVTVRARRNGDFVQVEVHDAGPGIEHPEKIFDAFFTTKESGMGMGLTISRSIVESHGGRLWVETSGKGGAAFIFTLPIEMPETS
jgi:PAS domain S-box-containing protein